MKIKKIEIMQELDSFSNHYWCRMTLESGYTMINIFMKGDLISSEFKDIVEGKENIEKEGN